MPTIVGLDIGWSGTAFAVAKVQEGSRTLRRPPPTLYPPPGNPYEARLLAWDDELSIALRALPKPDLFTTEKWLGAGGTATSRSSLALLRGWLIAQARRTYPEARWLFLSPRRVKRELTDNSAATKDEMMDAVHKISKQAVPAWTPENHHVADACAIAITVGRDESIVASLHQPAPHEAARL